MAVYKYKPGDTPSSIAAQNGISVQQLLAANPGVSQFSAGMGIKIPLVRLTNDQTAGTFAYKPQGLGAFSNIGTAVQGALQQSGRGWNAPLYTMPSTANAVGQFIQQVQQGIYDARQQQAKPFGERSPQEQAQKILEPAATQTKSYKSTAMDAYFKQQYGSGVTRLPPTQKFVGTPDGRSVRLMIGQGDLLVDAMGLGVTPSALKDALLQDGYVKYGNDFVYLGLQAGNVSSPNRGYGYGTSGDGRPLDKNGKAIGLARDRKGNIIRKRRGAEGPAAAAVEENAGSSNVNFGVGT